MLGGGDLGVLLPKETKQHAALSRQRKDNKPGGGKLGGGGALFLLPPEKPNEERESITMLTT